MKKQYVSLLAIILSVSGFLFSCHDKMNKNTGALQFDSIQVNKTAHLFNDTAKPACNIIINFAYPIKSSDDMLKDSLILISFRPVSEINTSAKNRKKL